ncbi:MAG: sialate O-acetylesterase, partial [Armatimonadetes bacterium]|nr:sialate O-acetylesterase [Armatimonadota bacterium]
MRRVAISLLPAFVVLLLALAVPAVHAEVTLPHLFCDNMVLQQGLPVPFWGKADPGETVTVRLCDEKASTIADANGRWMVKLPPLTYGGPFRVVIEGKNRIVLKNVLVGEVWVASGQSNMAFTLSGARNAEREIAHANYPKIRLFTVRRTSSLTPQEDVDGTWAECTPQTARGFSAVAYFFARELYEELGVPIGVIHSSWGGTPAEAWTPLEKLEQYQETRSYVERLKQQIAEHPDLVENWKKYNSEYNKRRSAYYRARAAWQKAVAKAKAEGTKPPPPPKWPNSLGSHTSPSALYNAMIHPLIPYGIRGVIWYQGESNAGRAYQYRVLFPAMIEAWRERWGEGDFPFLFVQLANFMAPQTKPD